MAEVRAQFWSARIAGLASPFDTAHLKVHYPAGEPDKFSGIAPALTDGAPYPAVLICPGINVGPEAYGWLAQHLAAAGFVVATFALIGELFAGQYGVTPGVDMSKLSPDGWGTGPSGNAIGDLLRALEELNAGPGPLTGAIDMSRVVIGGHSAGGSVALQNATPAYFPQLVGGFAYAAHAGLATVLGWPPATIMPVEGGVPFLLMAGTRDGVIGKSAARYDVESWDPATRTFEEALGPDSAYVVFEGANHFAMGHPEDPTAARGFLDDEPTVPAEKTREALADVVTRFCQAVTGSSRKPFESWIASPPAVVSSVRTK